eukprot:GHVQ01032884.1.p1 GENE.GHVQ01032884.1~~GHVQ01032884.1.p1  ORF type:complete len:627 (+),score=143.22 GHVQ01032884.1:571-2451(+)
MLPFTWTKTLHDYSSCLYFSFTSLISSCVIIFFLSLPMSCSVIIGSTQYNNNNVTNITKITMYCNIYDKINSLYQCGKTVVLTRQGSKSESTVCVLPHIRQDNIYQRMRSSRLCYALSHHQQVKDLPLYKNYYLLFSHHRIQPSHSAVTLSTSSIKIRGTTRGIKTHAKRGVSSRHMKARRLIRRGELYALFTGIVEDVGSVISVQSSSNNTHNHIIPFKRHHNQNLDQQQHEDRQHQHQQQLQQQYEQQQTKLQQQQGVVAPISPDKEEAFPRNTSSPLSSQDKDKTHEWAGKRIVIRSSKAIEDCFEGCSIAVNGVCLTVTHFNPSSSFNSTHPPPLPKSTAAASAASTVSHVLVNGSCLPSDSFSVDISPETLKRTNLGYLLVDDKVNIERAANIGGRNSGHYVQGHVDGKGEIIYKQMVGGAIVIKVRYPCDNTQGHNTQGHNTQGHNTQGHNTQGHNTQGGVKPCCGACGGGGCGGNRRSTADTAAAADDATTATSSATSDASATASASSGGSVGSGIEMIVEKGFVAVDGVSLTVTEVNRDDEWFTVMLVPHTQKHITLPNKKVGEIVNIEVDVMGKYVMSRGDERGREGNGEDVNIRLAIIEDRLEKLERRLHEGNFRH